ncbi:hypothetical protein FQR65_LT11362 [Abscondita terminalis]|nr:hypothetical protein FQR65_LT11362 [Abscondita terminalis]
MFQNIWIVLIIIAQVVHGAPRENQILISNHSFLEDVKPIINAEFAVTFKNILSSPHVVENTQHYIKKAVERYKQENKKNESSFFDNSTEHRKAPFTSQTQNELNEFLEDSIIFMKLAGDKLKKVYDNAKPTIEKTGVYQVAYDVLGSFKNYISETDEPKPKKKKKKKNKGNHNAE